MSEIDSLRIHLYGVQGSGSVFPSRTERQAQQELNDVRLLKQLFDELAEHADGDGMLELNLAEFLGGDITRANLLRFRDRFTLPESRVYGGWTTCCRIETADGYDIVIDCGSGFRICAQDLAKKWAGQDSREVFLFGSHSHFDHTEGFDQAVICFDPRNQLHVIAHRQFLQALDQNLGIFTKHVDVFLKGVQTPLSYELMPAQFDSCEIRNLEMNPPSGGDPLAHRYHDIREPMRIGDTTVSAFEVFHPAPCLAYRLDHAGKSFVFCTDHELRRGDDPEDARQVASLEAERRLRDHCQEVDLLYRDGQYFRAEYDGYQGIGTEHGVPRIDWGHSCVEDVLEMAMECGVKATHVGHHDPNRDWSERNWIDDTLRRKSDQTGLCFELARAETVIDL